MTTAVLVDDEPTLLSYLQTLLATAWPGLELLGTAANGSQAVALCRDARPDVVFLDIHMPGMNGLEVARNLPTDVHVVFVTAHDHYAVEAFESAAVDYLLKPVTAQRLAQTVARLKAREQQDRRALVSLLDQLTEATPVSYLRWLRAGLAESTELISVDDVVYFNSDHKYTRVVCATREHIVRTPIKTLAAELDPDTFWQISRSLIVRVDQVAIAERDMRGRYLLTLKDRPEKLRTSPAHAHLFKQM